MVSAIASVKLRTFWEDFRAGKKPVMLLMTPPQHGKSLSVIDFIAWAIGHDPHLHAIYSSFSDRLGIFENLRLQRSLDSPMYQRIFPMTRLNNKHVVTLAERALRNHEMLEFVGHEGYFRNTTVLGSITGEALDLSVTLWLFSEKLARAGMLTGFDQHLAAKGVGRPGGISGARPAVVLALSELAIEDSRFVERL